MEIREITTPDEKRRIARFILESLPDWFGIPEAPSASFTLPKRGGIRRSSMSWAC